MNIDTNTLIFIALAIMMILIVICFICNSINSSKINTLMDYSDEGDIISALKDYYDKVDYLIDDILHGGKSENDRNRIITDLLNEIKPTVEKAERTMWDKICDLFKWS